MHPPEAHSPADCSDAAQCERHYFDISHGKLHHDDSKSALHLRDNESARGSLRGRFAFNQNDVSRCNYGFVVVVVVSFVS